MSGIRGVFMMQVPTLLLCPPHRSSSITLLAEDAGYSVAVGKSPSLVILKLTAFGRIFAAALANRKSSRDYRYRSERKSLASGLNANKLWRSFSILSH